MPRDDLVVAVFASPQGADIAIRQLGAAGFDQDDVKVVGNGDDTDDRIAAIIGIPADSVVPYRAALRADNSLVVVRGDAARIGRARALLGAANPTSLDLHTSVRAPDLAN
jgi:hypothetical protein